jgi:hypothetical protein
MIKDGIKEFGVYTTKGGYVVEIIGMCHGYHQASLRTSPGVSSDGRTPDDWISIRPNGWQYHVDGTIPYLAGKWKNDLELVAQICDITRLDFDNLPLNIHLVDGYPMIVKESVEVGDNMPGFRSYASADQKYKDFIAPTPTKKELEAKPPNPAVEFGKRMFAYWLFEPTKTIALQAAKSARYALVLSILGSAGYGSFHPDHIQSFIMKCLPKVSILAPEIMK